MDTQLISQYATEGAPLVVADASAAACWRGRKDDGSGVTVEYMGQGIETLPKELLQTKKPGRQIRQFKSLGEATAFEREVSAALQKLHPQAARHPRFPNQSAYYIGPTRIYSVEVKFTSMLDSVLKGLKSEAQALVFDKKQKAQGLFVQQQGGGRGLLARKDGVLALVKFHHGDSPWTGGVAKQLFDKEPPRSKSTISLDGRILIFDSAHSQSDLAKANWDKPALIEAVGPAFEGNASGPLRVPGQQAPGGGFVQMAAGTYTWAYKDDMDIGSGASVCWLSRR